jgi:hypothetical protein
LTSSSTGWFEVDIRVFDKIHPEFVESHDQVIDHQRVAALIRQPGMRLLYRDKSSLLPCLMIAFNPASRRYTRFPFQSSKK